MLTVSNEHNMRLLKKYFMHRRGRIKPPLEPVGQSGSHSVILFGRKAYYMLHIYTDADLFADAMVVMAGSKTLNIITVF